MNRVMTTATRVLTALLFVVAFASAAEQTLVLKDGRKIPVTRLVRRDGQVLFETTKGERFSVPEAQVVSPPLASIPVYQAPGATAAPTAVPAAPVAGEQMLVLKDGRRIPVRRLARRNGQVLFETTRGEAFSVPESEVVSPSLETIPPAGAPPVPPVPTPVVEGTPEPAPTGAPTPAVAVTEAAPPTRPIFGSEEFTPLPDRWSIDYPEDPRFAKGSALDPYNQNTLKGDRPIVGDSVFLVFTGTLETPTELRRVPVGSGVSTADPSSLEFFGRGGMLFTTPRGIAALELFHGQTAFKPKTWALKATGAFNVNYLRANENNIVNIDVREGKTRRRQDFGLEEAFAELKLLTLSEHYDFVSVRAGIQPFISDFRGLIFSDFNLGARLFGNAANNRWQYNVAAFDLLEKETNSELNTFEKREQKVYVANVFRQDTFRLGYTFSASVLHSKDEASTHYDANGFLVRPAKIGDVRPHEVSSTYVGLAGDGHLGRLNISHAVYYAFGTDEHHPLSGRTQDISAQLAALELSIDKDWLRLKGAAVFASGDDDAEDDKAKGFDSIYDASNFAGGAFSFWSRSGIPLTQTGVLLKTPGSLLPSLRSNKFEGQANFVNPGLMLLNASLDAELTPKLKGVLNVNYLRFHKTGALDLLLFQPDIRKSIGIDVGAGFLYRPALNENIVFTVGATGLLPGGGFEDVYSSACDVPGCGADKQKLYNVFANLKLTY
jgi:hypothetical protein